MKKSILLGLTLLPLLIFAQTNTDGVRPLYDPGSIAEVRIEFKMDNWGDVLDSLRIAGEEFVDANISVDGRRYTDVGVRYIGDRSYATGQMRNPYVIKLDKNNEDQNHQGYRHLFLSSALRDPSMVREVLFHEIARKYMPSPLANYSKLYVNDKYIGLFVNLELPLELFQERNYHDAGHLIAHARVYAREAEGADCKKGILASMEYEQDVNCYPSNYRILFNSGVYEEIQKLTLILNQETKDIESILAVDEALWMLALNNTMINLSSYTGVASNYFLYRDGKGRFHPIHWDLNLSFGGYKNTGNGSDIDTRELHKLDPLLHADNPYRPLISKLLSNPLYKKMYLAHIQQIIDDNFANGLYERRARELQGQIVVPFSEDPHKQYTVTEFQSSLRSTIGKRSKIPGIIDLMGKRVDYLKTNPDLSALPSKITNVEPTRRKKFEPQRLTAFTITAQADRFPQRLIMFYRFDPTEPYEMVTMEEVVDNTLRSGTKKYSVSVDAPASNTVMQYYILSENAGMASFYPADYTSAPAEVSLLDLNR